MCPLIRMLLFSCAVKKKMEKVNVLFLEFRVLKQCQVVEMREQHNLTWNLRGKRVNKVSKHKPFFLYRKKKSFFFFCSFETTFATQAETKSKMATCCFNREKNKKEQEEKCKDTL